MINQQLINQLLINLLFAGLQVSKLVLSTVLLYPLVHQIYLPPAVVSQLGVVQKISEISMHIQYTRKSQKWSPKTSQSHQNEVPRGTQSRQNNENSEKVKSNENINIYSTCEGLGHQNSQEIPFKNQQKT